MDYTSLKVTDTEKSIVTFVSELLKKPYAERARIAQENPEAYAAAMNS